nr:uncharacterized protein LOC108074067 [Drosophila kikkawai]
MCKKSSCWKRLNICSKYRACIFWAVLNIVFGIGFIPCVISFVKEQDFPMVIAILGCLCGIELALSGLLLLIGVLKGVRSLVCTSIIICGMGIFFIHWTILPLVLYFIFSIVAFTYYQVDMAPDDRYRTPRRWL